MKTLKAPGLEIDVRFDEPDSGDVVAMILSMTEPLVQRRNRLMADLRAALAEDDTERVVTTCRALAGDK